MTTNIAPKTLTDMIVAGRYDLVEGQIIDEKYFPVNADRFTTKGLETIRFSHDVRGIEKILVEIDQRGFRPATVEELLAFGAENLAPATYEDYSKKLYQGTVIALGTSCERFGARYSPFFTNKMIERRLALCWLGYEHLGSESEFLVARKV